MPNDPDSLSAAFRARLAELDAYVNEYGDARVPPSGPHKSLGWFIVTQRRKLRNGTLSEAQRRALEDRGVELEPWESKRRNILAAFRQFARDHQHCDIPLGHVEYVNGKPEELYDWLRQARGRVDQIEPSFRSELEALGVDFAPRKTTRELVRRALMEFAAEHGHYDVPSDAEFFVDGTKVDVVGHIRRHAPNGADVAKAFDLAPIGDDIGPTRAKQSRNAWRRNLRALDRVIADLGTDAFHAHGIPRDTDERIRVGLWLDKQRGRANRNELTAAEFLSLDLRGMRWDGRASRRRMRAHETRARRNATDAQLLTAYAKWRTPWVLDALSERFTAFARRVAVNAHRSMPSHVELADVQSWAHEGLLDAFAKFDAARGVAFTTYARARINGAITDGQRNVDWVPRDVRGEQRELHLTEDRLRDELGRTPSDAEIAEELGSTLDAVRAVRAGIANASVGTYDAPIDGSEQLAIRDTLAAQDLTGDPDAEFHARELAREIRELLPDIDQWGDGTWTSTLVAFAQYRKEHGHLVIPNTAQPVEIPGGIEVDVAKRTHARRTTRRQGRTDPERDRYLEEMGFVFDAPEGMSLQRLRTTLESIHRTRQSAAQERTR